MRCIIHHAAKRTLENWFEHSLPGVQTFPCYPKWSLQNRRHQIISIHPGRFTFTLKPRSFAEEHHLPVGCHAKPGSGPVEPANSTGDVRFGKVIPRHSMCAIYAYIDPQSTTPTDRHIWQSHGVSGKWSQKNRTPRGTGPRFTESGEQGDSSDYLDPTSRIEHGT